MEGPMANQKALTSEQAILSRFQELRNEISSMGAKANEMAAESQEHELVLNALEPLDGGRRCYRMVGDVLVERTVAEVKPAVQGNKEQLDMVVEQLVKQLDTKKKELADFQGKYKIRIRGENEPREQPPAQESKKGSQGVLVGSS